MTYRIALVGNPNSGKTTLFNALTGSNQRVGNWPGVTVDKKEGWVKDRPDLLVEDLPGIYSLSPYTAEERISRSYLVDDKPDLIINLIDSSNLIRNLYLTSQLAELEIPMVLALNMTDVLEEMGLILDDKVLGDVLSVRTSRIVANRSQGIDGLLDEVDQALADRKKPTPLDFDQDLEAILGEIMATMDLDERARYFAIKAFEGDRDIIERLDLGEEDAKRIRSLSEAYQKDLKDDGPSIISSARYNALDRVREGFLDEREIKPTKTERIDRIVTNKYLGLPIFGLVMFAVYYLSISTVGTLATDAVNAFFEEDFGPWIGELMTRFDFHPALIGLVTEGIIAGLGAVLGFLPQLIVLFILLSILEDIGYMARVAFIMDRIFRSFGLSGKSFIPLMISTGCAVPGIQSSRTIENERDKKITIMTASFMPCSAKLPVIALIGGAFYPEKQALVSFSLYLGGILAVILSGLILQKFRSLKAEPSTFVMELPQYHAPRPSSVARDVLDEVKSYVHRAGSLILLSTIVIWFLSNFDFRLNMVGDQPSNSILAGLGKAIGWIFIPLGFGKWQAAVATMSGFLAKENIVSTLGVLMNTSIDLEASVGASTATLLSQLLGNQSQAYAFLLYNMLTVPCVGAVGAIRAEMGNSKWTAITLAYQLSFSYLVTLIVYQAMRFINYGSFDIFSAFALLALVLLVYLVVRKGDKVKGKRDLGLEMA